MKTVKNILIFTLFLKVAQAKTQTVADFDGNNYNTIVIGTQTWMKENLKTTHYTNGIAIPTSTSAVVNDSTSVFQWSCNNDTTNTLVYGRLYTWYSITGDDHVCPVGWHVPDNSEWETLANFLGGDSLAGSKMKEPGTLHWSSTNAGVNNSSLFTALPGGFRGNSNVFNNFGSNASFWSVTPFGSGGFQRGYWYGLSASTNILTSAAAVSNCGMSVRCVKDLSTGIHSQPSQNKTLLFPNPATTELTVQFENREKRELYFYSAQGELVLQTTTEEKTITFSVNKLEKGVYFLKIVSKDSAIERKFVKE